MPDFLPSPDVSFDGWASQFVDFLSGHTAELGLTAAQVTELASQQTLWDQVYLAHQRAHVAAKAATAAKDAARHDYERIIRILASQLQTNPSLSDELRRGAGLRLRDTIRTRAAAAGSRPVVMVDTSQRLRHLLTWRDEASPKSRAKPKGVSATEVWLFVGAAPPSGPEQFRLVGMPALSRYTVGFLSGDAGKTAYYNLRWTTTHAEPGPWSETVSATITG